MVATLPRIPRRISPPEFFERHWPELLNALRPEQVALPEALRFEVEIEDLEQCLYTLTVQADGHAQAVKGQSEEFVCCALIMDQAGFKALFNLLQRWLRLRTQQGDQATVRDFLTQYYRQFEGHFHHIKQLIQEKPAMVEVVFTDELDTQHVVTLEIGLPDEGDPLIKMSLSLADVPLDLHRQSDAAIQALIKAKVRLEGDTKYTAHLIDLIHPA